MLEFLQQELSKLNDAKRELELRFNMILGGIEQTNNLISHVVAQKITDAAEKGQEVLETVKDVLGE